MLKRSLPLLAFVAALQASDGSAQSLLGGLTPYVPPTPTPSTWRSDRADDAVEESVSAGKKTRVILRYQPGARTRVIAWLSAANQTQVWSEAKGLNAIALDLPASVVKKLADQADILSISIDATMRTTQVADASGAAVDGQKLQATLGIKAADSGRGVGVAIIDSGIAPTADLTGRISAFYDFTGSGAPVATAPSDRYGHGTYIAGLIAGSGSRSYGKYVGVAKAARLIGLKVLDAGGAGYTSDVIEAVEFATANKKALGIDIVNVSVDHPIYESAATDPLVQAVERAVRAGIVVVVSAGNGGMNGMTGEIGFAGITSPGNAPSALTVGSLRHRGTATRLDDARFGLQLARPHVVRRAGEAGHPRARPGSGRYAPTCRPALYKKSELRVDRTGYIKLSGTSVAAAVTSGHCREHDRRQPSRRG